MKSPKYKSHMDLDMVFNFIFFVKIVIQIVSTPFKQIWMKVSTIFGINQIFQNMVKWQPCNICNTVKLKNFKNSSYYTNFGKVCVLYRINSHNPQIVFARIWYFKFYACALSIQANFFSFNFYLSFQIKKIYVDSIN